MAKASRRPVDDDEDDEPRGKNRPDDEEEDDDEPEKPRKKKESAAGPVKLVFKIIGLIAGAIGLVVLLFWIYSPVGIDSSMLCYFPPETNSLTGYDAEEVAKNAKMAEVHTQILAVYKRFGDERFTQDSGVSDKDVSRYLSGFASGDPEEEKDLPQQERRGGITVIKFKLGVDQEKFINSFTETSQFRKTEMKSRDGTKSFWHLERVVRRGGGEEREADISFFFPNSRTLVYTTTRKECEIALGRVPGRVVLKDTIKELAEKVDGHFFTANGGFTIVGGGGGLATASPFGYGTFNADIRNPERYFTQGTASWFASNGNHFLYGELKLYGDRMAAKQVAASLNDSLYKAQEQIYQNDGGSVGGLDDPFKPKAPPGGGAPGFGGSSNTDTKDIVEGMNAWMKTARAYRRDRAVVVEGRIEHGTQEQGTFEKFWKAIGPKVVPQPPQNFGGGGFGGPPGMGGPPPGFGGPPGGGPPPVPPPGR